MHHVPNCETVRAALVHVHVGNKRLGPNFIDRFTCRLLLTNKQSQVLWAQGIYLVLTLSLVQYNLSSTFFPASFKQVTTKLNHTATLQCHLLNII